MNAWRDIAVVAGQELFDSLRSRRVVVLALLFLGGAVAGTYGFVRLLQSIEEALADTLAVATPDAPGAITRALMQTEELLEVLTRLIRDRDLAQQLVDMPPLALFYGWLALTFVPTLVVFTASETVAADLSSGAARYSLVRTDRLSWSAGKLVGQAVLMTISIFAGALGTWLTGYIALNGFDPGRTAWWLLMLSVRVEFMAFAYLGLAIGLSHMTRSVPLSRALGLVALALVAIARGLLQLDWSQDHLAWLGDLVLPILPRTYQLELWRPDFADRMPAIVMLLGLGLCFFSVGYLFRVRRDA